jgi:hypothetical protein
MQKVTLDQTLSSSTTVQRNVYNWLQYFSPEDIEREFANSGFFVESLYSDVAGTPYDKHSGEFAVVAKKRSAEPLYGVPPDRRGKALASR